MDHSITTIGIALADPTRLAILSAALGTHGISVGELARAVGYSVSTTSFHLGKLREAGLVELRRSGRRTLVIARHDRWRVIRDAIIACQTPGLARDVLSSLA